MASSVVSTESSSTQLTAAAGVDTSNHVYIKSEEYAWIPARVLETEGHKAKVSIPQYKDEQAIQSDGGRASKRFKTEIIDLKEYPNSALLLQNVDQHGRLTEVEDMVDLPFLHEAAILYNLKKRHVRGNPYTRTGDIVIACNPYKWYNDLYSEKMRHLYADSLVWHPTDVDARSNLKPHVYETSSLAYRGLAVDGEDQSILVSGESGAGKTETVKILLSDLASVQRGMGKDKDGPSFQSPIVQRVLDSNPLLEAFGNAKTLRNDNSSRFGKYIQLQFDAEDPVAAANAGKVVPSCVLAGSKSEVYLLEKSRVVIHEEEERTYHIFYQLLAADEEIKMQIWEGLEGTDNESYSYVGYTETDTIEGKTDEERFQYTVDSLALIGIKDEKLRTLMRAICIVLQLGNLVFEPDGGEGSIISSEEEFEELSELMGVPASDLLSALTIRTMRARNEEFKVPLNDAQAKDSVDAFAKEIYAKTFLWLVRSINDATSAEKNYDGDKKSGYGLIGLLDIFGFESFETNRFEQLCINYANEKLQQKFTEDIFRSVQAEYEYEGIELEEITYDDNTDVLDLVEGRMGLLAFLNEECVRPGGNDKGFVMKVQAMNKNSPCFFIDNHFEDCEFGIVHYAGAVVYDAENFVTKNMDTLPSDLQDCATKSTNAILANELGNESMVNAATAKPKKKRKVPPKKKTAPPPKKKGSNLVGDTVWTKFKNQLEDLMASLKKTRTRYIRCLKPNSMKKPLLMEHVATVQQLRCAGVVAAVTISRSAFPNRLEHEVVLERFRSLWAKGQQAATLAIAEEEEDFESLPRILATALLTSALKALEVERDDTCIKAFVIGRTRAYFRAGALEFLEAERLKKLGEWAGIMQRNVRRFVARSQYTKMRHVIIVLQSITRRNIAHLLYQQLRYAAIMVQCWYRKINAARTLVILRRNFKATLIQNRWRMGVAMVFLKRNQAAAIAVQTMVRGALQRPKFRIALHEKREEAKLENQVLALQRKLEEAEARRLEAEKQAEEKAQRMIEEFRESAHSHAAQEAEEEKKESHLSTPVSPLPDHEDEESEASPVQLSAQQQTLMDESGKMLEYLRKEVFKLRSQNAQMRTDFDLLKDNNQRLMDANASAGASFAALNQHAKHLSRANEKLSSDLTGYKQQVQKLSVTQIELKEELKMKQATYVAEVHSRLQYQKSMARILNILQEKCSDTRLVEEILNIADACEADFMSGTTSSAGTDGKTKTNPSAPTTTPSKAESNGLMSSFVRSFWG